MSAPIVEGEVELSHDIGIGDGDGSSLVVDNYNLSLLLVHFPLIKGSASDSHFYTFRHLRKLLKVGKVNGR